MSSLVLGGIFYIFYLITKFSLALYVYKDGKSLLINPIFWSIAVILCPNYIGFVLYLIIRTIKFTKTSNNKENDMIMHKNKIKIITILTISILTIVATFSYLADFLNTTQHYRFDTYQDSIPIMEKGWIPNDIPKTATDIYVIYDLDTNIVNGKFKLSETQTKEFFSTLKPVDQTAFETLGSIDAKWWPEKEINDNIKDNIFLTGKNNDFIYALDPSGTVYFWIK